MSNIPQQTRNVAPGQAAVKTATWKYAVAGIAASIAKEATYPLENIRMRFMAANSAKNNPIP